MTYVEQRRPPDDGRRQLEASPSLAGSILRYRTPILAAAIVVGALFYALSSLQSASYAGTATVVLGNSPVEGVLQAGNSNNFIDPERYVPQQANLVTSRPVLQRAGQEVDLTVDQLENVLSVEADPALSEISVTAEAGDPERAARVANAVVDAYESISQEQSVAQFESVNEVLQERMTALRDQIDEVENRLRSNPGDSVSESRLRTLEGQLLALETRSSEISASAVTFGSGVQLRENALPPAVPTSPQPRRDGMIAAALAFGLAAAVAYWRAGTTKRVESRMDPEDILGIPLLGEIPRFDHLGENASAFIGRRDVSEAYQFVLSSVEYSMASLNASSVMVTSATAGEGKTSTALQLAVASAHDTRTVMLVDADIRARGLTKMLRGDKDCGLSQLAAGNADLEDCIRKYRLSTTTKLSVIHAGTTPSDSVGLMRSAEFGKVMAEIKTKAELTIFDSPPLLSVADATVLASRVDAIVLVVDSNAETEQLRKLRERLAFVPTPLLGYVYNRATSEHSASYGDDDDEPGSRWSRGWRQLFPGRGGARASAPHDADA